MSKELLSDYSDVICLENFGFKFSSNEHEIFMIRNNVEFFYNDRDSEQLIEVERRIRFISAYIYVHFMRPPICFPTIHFSKIPFLDASKFDEMCNFLDLPLSLSVTAGPRTTLDQFRSKLEQIGGMLDNRMVIYVIQNNVLLPEFKYEARNIKGLWLTTD